MKDRVLRWKLKTKIRKPSRKAIILLVVTVGLWIILNPVVSAVMFLWDYPDLTYLSVEEVPWSGPTELPDIYLIILDEYPGVESLANYFDYDNSDFIEELRSLGFYVPELTYGSYPRTAMVLASILNMQYLDPSLDSSEIKDVWYQNSSVGRRMQELGYTYVHIGSGWFGTIANSYADVNLVKKPTFWEAMNRHYVNWIQNLPFQIDTVEKLAEVPQSTFVVMHSLGCHLPQIFSNPGDTGLDPTVLQTRYMNTLMLDTLNTIISRSSTPPIIILMSDHGQFVDRPDFSEDQILARLNTLEAFYLPKLSEEQKIGFRLPVNIFSSLFNLYFGDNYDILPQKNYYVDSWEDLNHLHLVDKTELILGE
jgi:hypothetical protein